jgi:BirA family biotin operon repressor/biotin-[acetyl-CoA-carboxylase] ligase
VLPQLDLAGHLEDPDHRHHTAAAPETLGISVTYDGAKVNATQNRRWSRSAHVIPPDLERCSAAFSSRGRIARVVSETGSTNDDARTWAQEGAPHGAVVIADMQRSGRGRHGRAWSSPSGESLAISIVLRPELPPAALPPVALVAGLAARRAIDRRLPSEGPRARVKWPNDVVVSMRKIAGILVEGAIAGRSVDHVVVGVGINVSRTEFPSELAHATSLAREGATDLARDGLALDLCEALDDELAVFLRDPSSIGERVSAHDALRSVRLLLEDGSRGLGDGVESDGRLRIRLENGSTVRARAGEVRVDA